MIDDCIHCCDAGIQRGGAGTQVQVEVRKIKGAGLMRSKSRRWQRGGKN